MLSPGTTLVGLVTNVLEMRFKVKISILLLTLAMDLRETNCCSCKFEFRLWMLFIQSKKEGNDQESIQLSTTPDPGYQWESDNFTIRYHK